MLASVSGGYLVGNDPGDPYSNIQDAIDAAVTAGASFASPEVIQVKPGTYSGDINLYEGICVIALASGKSHMTRLQGSLTYAETIPGTAQTRLASWIGIDVVQAGSFVFSALRFTGAHPQRLNVWNCSFYSDTALIATALVNNTGADSVLVMENVTIRHGDSYLSVLADNGNIIMNQAEVGQAHGVLGMQFNNDARVDSYVSDLKGQVEFSNTASGFLSNAVIDANGTPAFLMESTGTLELAYPYIIGGGDLTGGTYGDDVFTVTGIVDDFIDGGQF